MDVCCALPFSLSWVRLCLKCCDRHDSLRDLVETFARRKLRNTRFETFEDSYRRSIYHRLAQVQLKSKLFKFLFSIRPMPC